LDPESKRVYMLTKSSNGLSRAIVKSVYESDNGILPPSITDAFIDFLQT